MGFSFLKPGAYVDLGPVGEWAEQNGGGKKQLQNSKASPFAFIFFLFAFRTTDELTVWICLSLLNWCNTDNVQYRVDSWQFAISPRTPRFKDRLWVRIYIFIYIFFLFLYFSIEFLRGSVGVVRIGGPWTGP